MHTLPLHRDETAALRRKYHDSPIAGADAASLHIHCQLAGGIECFRSARYTETPEHSIEGRERSIRPFTRGDVRLRHGRSRR